MSRCRQRYAPADGQDPVYCDTSPCLYRMRSVMTSGLGLHYPVGFIYERLMDRLSFHPQATPIAVHHTCSAVKMGLEAQMLAIARRCAPEVVVPDQVGCCGFAGDRGFTFPELNASALAALAPAVDHCSAGDSTSRTCEIGLSPAQRDLLQIDHGIWSIGARRPDEFQISNFKFQIRRTLSPRCASPGSSGAFGSLFYVIGFFHRLAPAVMTQELMRDFNIVSAAALGNLSGVLLLQLLADADPHRDSGGQLGASAAAHLRRTGIGCRRGSLCACRPA